MKVYPQKIYGELTEILPIIRGKRRERFLAKIDRTWVWPHGCQLWTGHTNQLGYGLVQGTMSPRGRRRFARTPPRRPRNPSPNHLLVRRNPSASRELSSSAAVSAASPQRGRCGGAMPKSF